MCNQSIKKIIENFEFQGTKYCYLYDIQKDIERFYIGQYHMPLDRDRSKSVLQIHFTVYGGFYNGLNLSLQLQPLPGIYQ